MQIDCSCGTWIKNENIIESGEDVDLSTDEDNLSVDVCGGV